MQDEREFGRLTLQVRSLNTTQGAAAQFDGEHSLQPVLAELEEMFRMFAALFPLDMPQPVITIQAAGRRRAVGWFAAKAWQNSDPDKPLPEINMSAEALRRDPEGIAETLIHEMAHYANHLEGIRDCSGNQYHNRKFKERAESVGLIVEKHATRGWASTRLHPALWDAIQSLDIRWGVFDICRKMKPRAAVGSRMRKWRCECTTIRAAVEVDARCNKCGAKFVFQDAQFASKVGLNTKSMEAD